MKITKIEPQKGNSLRFNLYLDGKFSLGISEQLVVRESLSLGQEVSAKQLERLKRDDSREKIWGLALRYLSYRPRSKEEMTGYLTRKKIGIKLIKKIVKKLEKQGYLDDQRFAKSWIEDRKNSLKGPRLIRLELIKKGVAKEKVELALKSWYNKMEEEKIAQQALEKKAKGKIKKELTFKEKGRFHRFLLQRGFNYDIIRELLRKV
jgi:regulatory protein